MERKSRTSASQLVRVIPLVLLVAACATGAIREKILSLPQIEGATPVGQTACAECHEDAAKKMAKNVHGRLADFELMGGTGGCEACHGGGSLHVKAAGNGQILKFGELPPEESAAVCAKCHSSGKLMEWTHGEHALADVACGDCHAIHGGEKFAEEAGAGAVLRLPPGADGQGQLPVAPSDQGREDGLLRLSEPARRTADRRAGARRPGAVECHARYQGPFVFELDQVGEDCSLPRRGGHDGRRCAGAERAIPLPAVP